MVYSKAIFTKPGKVGVCLLFGAENIKTANMQIILVSFYSIVFGDLTDTGICCNWYQRKHALEAEIRPKLVSGRKYTPF